MQPKVVEHPHTAAVAWSHLTSISPCRWFLTLPSDAGPLVMVPRPLPRVLIVHTGGTLGMDPVASYESDLTGQQLKKGGAYKGTLGPGQPLLLLVGM